MIILQVNTQAHSQMIDVTTLIQDMIPREHTGSVLIYTPHTTAGITINEGADPDVQKDALMMLDQIVP